MTLIKFDAIQIEYLEVGAQKDFKDGWLHHKILPFAIFVQPTRGSYRVLINGRTERIRAGEMAFVPSNTPVTFIHDADRSGAMASRWIHLRATWHGGVEVIDLLKIPAKLSMDAARVLGASIAKMLALTAGASSRSLLAELRQKELGYGMLRQLGEQFAVRKTGLDWPQRASRFSPVFEYVRAHLGETISVGQLARTVSLSPSRFFPLFKKTMSQSPMAYVQTTRLARARELLQDNSLTIAQVAETVGFLNQFHFSRVFKKQFKMPPRLYRQRFALSPPGPR